MSFITIDDFPASIHLDILNALTKNNDTVVVDNSDRTIDEMKGYLNGRYDTAAIFSAEGNNRNKFLLRIALSITVYYIFLTHNPRKLSQTVVDEYERSIEILKEIQSGKMNPENLPLKQPDNPGSTSGNGMPMQWGSDDQVGSSW